MWSSGEGRDREPVESVTKTIPTIGSYGAASGAAVQDQNVKNRLRHEAKIAISRGATGSPFILVDDEPFWEHDRFNQAEHWLATGGI